jgi:hypothetical protein
MHSLAADDSSSVTRRSSAACSFSSSPPPPPPPSCLLLESADLIREVASFLVDDATTLCRLSCVSKSCHAAVVESSPQVWKATCRHRWAAQWGFTPRWKAALQDERKQNASDTRTMVDGRWWRTKYQWQEQDAKRTSITAEELHSFTFDFRFWLSQFWGQGNLLASGLKWTASQEFRFASRNGGDNEGDAQQQQQQQQVVVHPNPSEQQFSWPGLERGMLQGHPSGRDDLEWFLDQDGAGMQWGKLPMLWPKGTVHRLDTWGWEIRNPNVCLRAMDYYSAPSGVALAAGAAATEQERSTGADTTKSTSTSTSLELVKNDESLWSDYLASLRRYPTDFGMPQEGIAFMEAPEQFWEFLQNRQRFPRLGIDDNDTDTENNAVLGMEVEQQQQE